MVGDMFFTPKKLCCNCDNVDTIFVILCYEGNKVIITTELFFAVKPL